MIPLTITPASEEELSLVMEVVDEAAQWLIAKGIQQWESPPPPDCLELFEREIARRQVYLVRRQRRSEAIGTFRLEWTGAPLWPDEKSAGYVYNLALRPEHVGQGIGRLLIDWVKEHIRTQGRNWFRLDCIAGNDRLRRLYEELGFCYRGIGITGTYVLALYELELRGGG